MNTNSETIILRPRKSQFFLFLILFVWFAWFSVFLFTIPGDAWIGGLVSLGLAAGLLFGLIKLNPFMPSLILTAEGMTPVFLPTKERNLIPWENITAIHGVRVRMNARSSTWLHYKFIVVSYLDKSIRIPSVFLPYDIDTVMDIFKKYTDKVSVDYGYKSTYFWTKNRALVVMIVFIVGVVLGAVNLR